ncbi:MAG: glycosyl transferase [Flavobacteriales bacterium]|nr:glycosyl transferase [Flavobacteriales bacterium]|tara:strand:- start:4182 stop:5279 length:1098 start_codon:yes stop_codon:yes gene_type:complete
MKVCHLTSAHQRNDTRIFLKECISLAKAEFEVSLVVSDGMGDTKCKGVSVFDVGKTKGGRLSRFFSTTQKVYEKAVELDADVYHFHDPELMFYAYRLKRLGKKVIYDVHEDLPRQLMSKPYLSYITKKVLPFLLERIENFLAARFDLVITATPFIRDRFLKINKNTIDVNNYPLLEELHSADHYIQKKNQICYLGGITAIRGIEALVKACELIDGELVLAGKFNSRELEEKVRSLPGWKKVKFLGFINREEARKILAESKAGVVTFLPEPNHINAQPNKMFEYMSASLPVIASHFTLWKSIIEDNDCGICVNPASPKELAQAMNTLLNKHTKGLSYGKNGRQAVENQFNWAVEEKKFISQYHKLA